MTKPMCLDQLHAICQGLVPEGAGKDSHCCQQPMHSSSHASISSMTAREHKCGPAASFCMPRWATHCAATMLAFLEKLSCKETWSVPR